MALRSRNPNRGAMATMRRIKLTKGYFALVDNKYYERVIAAGPWQALETHGKVYAYHKSRQGRSMLMHRFILGVLDLPKIKIDHKDGCGLNNRRNNLRKSTHAQNQQNQKLSKANTSGYKGVCWDGHAGKWKASVSVGGHSKHLGLFSTAKKAALAYDTAACAFQKEYIYARSVRPMATDMTQDYRLAVDDEDFVESEPWWEEEEEEQDFIEDTEEYQ
jgi:hypothetical protein